MAFPVLRRTSEPTTRWDPFSEFEDLYERMGRLMDAVWNGLDRQVGTWSPLADLTETDDAYLIEVDLPGVKRDQVTVEVTGGQVTISGQIGDRDRPGVLRRATRRQGRFEYRTSLPGDVDPEKVTASLSDGVLTVRIPKTDSAKPRRIEITSG